MNRAPGNDPNQHIANDENLANVESDAGFKTDAEVEALLGQMDLGEKLSMLSGATAFWPGLGDTLFRDGLHRHPWPAAVLPRLGLNGLHFVDGPRGVILEGGATTFPVPMARGASWNPELEERIGRAMAREARSFGANWLGAVCVNLLRHPAWGRAQETYGEDPMHVGAMGAALVRGIQRYGLACVKHFALNSIDSARFQVDVLASPRVLHELFLPQFRECVEAGALSVMSAYNKVNGEWCGQHPDLLNNILKTQWGFQGFVVTDFIFGLRDGVRALRAGQDLEMPFRMLFEASLPQAIATGQIPGSRVDDAVRRIVKAQRSIPKGTDQQARRQWPAHRQLAREAATQSIVLLKNDGQLLPLKGIQSIAVIGNLAATPNLGDRGSSNTRPAPGSVVTPLEGIRKGAPDSKVWYQTGVNRKAAAALAAKTDVAVVVVGLDWRHEGEHIHTGDIAPVLREMPPPDWLWRRLGRGRVEPWWRPIAWAIAGLTSLGSFKPGGHFASGDRNELGLEKKQENLVLAVAQANSKTIVVLMGGSAILCESWRQKVAALVMLWYPGSEGGDALADILLGRISPSGRLPFAIPTCTSHLPEFNARAQQIIYDGWHGYRLLEKIRQPAAFPFGFGLSYSQFEHAKPQVALDLDGQTMTVEVQVTNTGGMAAADVIQLYVEPPGKAVERPLKILVGFARVHLEPKQMEEVRVTVPMRRLAFFAEGPGAFVVEGGLHHIVVGTHAEDIGLRIELELEEMVVRD